MKKLISLIIILLIVLLSAYVVFNDFITETLWPDESTSREAVSAMCIDKRGNVYYVQDVDGENRLVATDDAGNVFLDKVLDEIGSSAEYLVTDIYVSDNNNILIGTMTYDRSTEQTSAITMHVFYEDGAYAVQALNQECSQNVISSAFKGTRFSSVSEDGTYVYFGLYRDGVVQLYGLKKGTYEIAEKLAQYDYDGEFTYFIPTGADELVFGGEFGKLCVLTKDGTRTISMPSGVIIGRLWPGESGYIFVYDAAEKDVYKVNLEASSIEAFARGTTVVSSSQQVTFGDFRNLYITSDALVGGMRLSGGEWQIFSGGATFMNYVTTRNDDGFDIDIFGVIGIFVSVVLLSILIWDGFVGFFKMHMSIMIRSAILVTVSVVAMLYSLLNYIIAPSMQTILTKQYEDRLFTAASVIASAITASEEGTPTYAVFQNVGAEFERNMDSVSPVHFDLLTKKDEGGAISLSSDGIDSGSDADILPMRAPLGDYLDQAGDIALSFETYESTGPKMYELMPLSNGQILLLSASTESVEASINNIVVKTEQFLTYTGLIMVFIFMLIEFYTAFSVRKLKKGVDEVSAGNYNITTRVNSGDEVESLSNSFNTMTRFIRENMLRLERINRAYFRFVPENLLRILGVSSIENLGKASYIKRVMTVLVVNFRFDDQNQSAEELFTKINQVTERIAPVVAKNSGTVYDFKYDGFHAVFDESTENAIRAALQIREEAEALNNERSRNGQKPVDVRIVIGMGDVMLGIIGDENRMSASAISEVINTANTLVDICRESDIYIGCTKQVFEGVKGYRSRYIGIVEIKRERVELYDVFDGDPYALLKHKEMYAQQFAQAVALFYNRDYENARYLFMQIVQASLKDGVSRNYMYFADKYGSEGCNDPAYELFNNR